MEMLKEIEKNDKNLPWQYAGMASLESFTSFDEWLDKINKESEGEDLLPNRVPASTYVLASDDQVVGIYNIRHELNDYLLNYGGHIGYSINPKMRQKGYGTKGLELALIECEKMGINKVLITCNVKNIASARVIEKCRGKLENIIIDKNGNELKRYWIDN